MSSDDPPVIIVMSGAFTLATICSFIPSMFSAKLRNAKIRLSNIKLDQIVQVMRGKSKWIKH